VDTKTTTGPFAQGSGFVNPNGAANPGLVYPTLPNEYRSYMISLGVQFNPPFNTLPPISASNLNQASIAIGGLAGVETVTRRVKNVGTSKEMYKPTASVPGFDIKVKPAQINLSPGEEATFTIEFTRKTAPLGAWATGSLTWTSNAHAVRSPIALQPVAVSAPGEVHVNAPFQATGSQDYQVTAGFTGTLDTSVAGLVAGTADSASVTTGAFDINNPVADGASTIEYVQAVPTGTKVARFSLDAVDNNADLDLFVYIKIGNNLQFVDLSASGAADEQVTLMAPADGEYHVFVNGFATPGGSTAYTLNRFVVPDSPAGNLTVTDNVNVSIASPVTLTLNWSGLDPSKRYLGVVSYANSTDTTVVSIG
jgi:Fibronectin type-III domain